MRISHRGFALSIGNCAVIPGHAQNVRRRIIDKFAKVLGGIACGIRQKPRPHLFALDVLCIEAINCSPEVDDRLAKGSAHDHDEGMADGRATPPVPGDSTDSGHSIMECAGRCKSLRDGSWRCNLLNSE